MNAILVSKVSDPNYHTIYYCTYVYLPASYGELRTRYKTDLSCPEHHVALTNPSCRCGSEGGQVSFREEVMLQKEVVPSVIVRVPIGAGAPFANKFASREEDDGTVCPASL